MTYVIGAFLLTFISVRALNQGHKIYVEQSGAVTRVVAVAYTAVGLLTVFLAYRTVNEFLTIMEWSL